MKWIVSVPQAVLAPSEESGGASPANPGYMPVEGDSVVVYYNKFKEHEFDRAKDMLVNGFREATSASGQTRRTYWIANPESNEIIGVCFFEEGHTVEDWHADPGRQKVLDALEPLRSEPLRDKRLKVIGSYVTGK